ncbi:CU044_2847 family protein [Actinosynnema sp. NPDC023658]|uniref:CU044_2847 family protein n=1 Tax=Actinosynnema sp. NPDC023658 TaxID=3155465 RepID=UPI00340EC940
MELDPAGSRQISAKYRSSALLEDRRDEIQDGIRAAVDVVRASLESEQERNGWQVTSVEATFGITLSAEAGVILTRASAEASFEVTLTVERV